MIGSGGGEGIFNISLGANIDFAEKAERIFRQYGLKTISKYYEKIRRWRLCLGISSLAVDLRSYSF